METFMVKLIIIWIVFIFLSEILFKSQWHCSEIKAMYDFYDIIFNWCFIRDILVGTIIIILFYFISKDKSFWWITISSFLVVNTKMLIIVVNVLMLELGIEIILNNLGDNLGVILGALGIYYYIKKKKEGK